MSLFGTTFVAGAFYALQAIKEQFSPSKKQQERTYLHNTQDPYQFIQQRKQVHNQL